MAQETQTAEAALAACIPCRNAFIVTPDRPNCIICGQAPIILLSFNAAGYPAAADVPAEPLAAAEPVEETILPVKCPCCEANLELRVSPQSVSLVVWPGIESMEGTAAPFASSEAAVPSIEAVPWRPGQPDPDKPTIPEGYLH